MSTSILCDPITDGFTLQAAPKRDRYNMHNTLLNDPACLTVAVQSGSPNQPMFMLDTQRRPGVCQCRERRVWLSGKRVECSRRVDIGQHVTICRYQRVGFD